MTHYQILLSELDQHGRTTYRDLIARYAGRGYTYGGFISAAQRLRRRGLLAPARRGETALGRACAARR